MVQRRTLLLPVRNELVQSTGLNHGTRKNLVADLGALLEDDHTDLLALLLRELLDLDGSAETGGTTTDNQHVNLVDNALVFLHRLLGLLLFLQHAAGVEGACTRGGRQGRRSDAHTLEHGRARTSSRECFSAYEARRCRCPRNASDLAAKHRHIAVLGCGGERRRRNGAGF